MLKSGGSLRSCPSVYVRLTSLVLLLLSYGLINQGLAGDISLSAGVGYEFMNQEFYQDSTFLDSLDELASQTTYMDDFKGQLGIELQPFGDTRLVFQSRFEITPDLFRARFRSDYRSSFGKARLNCTGELDWRGSHGDSVGVGDCFVYGQGKAHLRYPVSESISLWSQLRSDFVKFDSLGTHNFDHYRFGVKLGATQLLTDFSSIDLSFSVLAREVPDSSRLNYQSYGIDLAYFGFHSRSQLDILGHFENRAYGYADRQNDYRLFEIDGRFELDLGRFLVLTQVANLDMVHFMQDDQFSPGHTRFGLDLLLGVKIDALQVGLGPHMDVLVEHGDDVPYGEDYVEFGGIASIDYLKPGLLFLSVESVTGHRNLQYEADQLSDFFVERLNLLADWRILRSLSFNILFSAEWEWHSWETENNRILLISSGLSYRY